MTVAVSTTVSFVLATPGDDGAVDRCTPAGDSRALRGSPGGCIDSPAVLSSSGRIEGGAHRDHGVVADLADAGGERGLGDGVHAAAVDDRRQVEPEVGMVHGHLGAYSRGPTRRLRRR